jgi:polyadenylate-binding protein
MFPRGGRGYRYPTGRGMPDPGMHGVGGVMPSPYEMAGGMPLRDAGVSQPVPIGALATALANAPPDQQRLVRYSLFDSVCYTTKIVCDF